MAKKSRPSTSVLLLQTSLRSAVSSLPSACTTRPSGCSIAVHQKTRIGNAMYTVFKLLMVLLGPALYCNIGIIKSTHRSRNGCHFPHNSSPNFPTSTTKSVLVSRPQRPSPGEGIARSVSMSPRSNSSPLHPLYHCSLFITTTGTRLFLLSICTGLSLPSLPPFLVRLLSSSHITVDLFCNNVFPSSYNTSSSYDRRPPRNLARPCQPSATDRQTADSPRKPT